MPAPPPAPGALARAFERGDPLLGSTRYSRASELAFDPAVPPELRRRAMAEMARRSVDAALVIESCLADRATPTTCRERLDAATGLTWLDDGFRRRRPARRSSRSAPAACGS